VNLPNYITLSRIAAVPLIIWILTTSYFSAKEQTLRVVLASGLFILASITDGLDGYLARRRGQITTMGMLLDPLADKLMIAACYITLVHLIPEIVNVWVVVLIIGLAAGLGSRSSSTSPSRKSGGGSSSGGGDPTTDPVDYCENHPEDCGMCFEANSAYCHECAETNSCF